MYRFLRAVKRLSNFNFNTIMKVKTRMQGLEAKKYKGTLDCIVQTMNKEGIPGFWKCVYICSSIEAGR